MELFEITVSVPRENSTSLVLFTLFGLYEAIESVKTPIPLTPRLMKAFAATLAL
jgi:hypothetical protein